MSTFTQKLKNNPEPLARERGTAALKLTEYTPPTEAPEVGGLFVVRDHGPVHAQRLVVLMPNWDVDEAEVAREIWNLAFPPGLAVLFVGLCPNVNQESTVRRRVATVAALTRDVKVPVEVQIEFGQNWLHSLPSVLEPGDIVVCHAEQRTGLWGQPLEIALAHLNIPTLTLKGLVPSAYQSTPIVVRESVFWLVSIAVLFIFFLFQVRLLRISEEWARDALLSFSILVEFGIFGVWNNLSH